MDVLKGELHINDVSFYPAKLLIENLGQEQRINYKVTNYSDKDMAVVISERDLDKVTEGYKPYDKSDNIWIVIPERHFIVKAGKSYNTEVIIGIPSGCELDSNVEMWVSMKSKYIDSNVGLIDQILELNSRILIKKGGETK